MGLEKLLIEINILDIEVIKVFSYRCPALYPCMQDIKFNIRHFRLLLPPTYLC
jgi:hypothetical protein